MVIQTKSMTLTGIILVIFLFQFPRTRQPESSVEILQMGIIIKFQELKSMDMTLMLFH